MIYGVGTDIINIDRVEQILNKNKDGFVHRVLSEHEQALFAGVMSSMQLNHGCTALLGGVNLVFL
jgi:holo-[acyl-carrier protein] synthase